MLYYFVKSIDRRLNAQTEKQRYKQLLRDFVTLNDQMAEWYRAFASGSVDLVFFLFI